MPLMMWIAVCAESIICTVLTEKWIFCTPYVRIFCVIYAFYPIHTANLNAMNSIGRSDLYLKLEIIKTIINVLFLLATVSFGVFYLALGYLFSTIICIYVNIYPNKFLLNYDFIHQIKDLIPNIIITVLMGICVFILNYLPISSIVLLLLQLLFGIMLYWFFSVIFKNESYLYLRKFLLNYNK